MDKEENQKTVLVTGSSRGIGLGIAQHFENLGYQMLMPSRRELDLENEISIETYMTQNALEIDVLINNAGFNEPCCIEEMDWTTWQKTLMINVSACMLLAKAVFPHMKIQKWGRIINISSCFSLVTKEGRTAYTTSKSALNGLTKSLALEGAADGILVNAVCPGFVDTDMLTQNNSKNQIEEIVKSIPMGRVAQTEEISHLISWLASNENTYLTGQTLVADGGFVLQ